MKYEYNDPILKPRRKELRNKATEADKERASYLEGHDIKIVRFWNEAIINDLEKVVKKIIGLLPPS